MEKRTNKPTNKFYNTTSNGGYSCCIVGSPTDKNANVLSNCVGYACGRFNEIIGEMKYPYLNCNAENFIERAKEFYNLKVVSYPVLGGIMVWKKGTTLKGNDGAGHVEVVEELIDKNTILTANFKATSTVPNATLSYLIVEQPAHGTLVHTKESDKSFTYTPDLDYVGTDSFTFKVSDGTSISNIATISITISVPAEEIIPFNYIDMQNHWANYSASHLAARSLIIGEEIGSRYYFYPERQMTRADFILFLLAITESNEDATIEIPKVTFADEKNTPDWLIEAAKLAYAKGIIKGSAEGNKLYLNAYNPLSRKEAVVMIDNVLTLTNSTERLTYEDTSLIPEWATQAVKNLTAYKIIQGDSENRFSPNKIITRAEAAEMCYKTVKQLESEEMPNISGDKITSGDTSGDIK